MTKFIKISSDMVQYNIDNSQEVNESFASLLLNPYVTWAKFILTDDEPNGNNVRIPKEEFSNLINSGIYMPIKMTLGEIEGHEASIPIGVITHLKEVKNSIFELAYAEEKGKGELNDLERKVLSKKVGPVSKTYSDKSSARETNLAIPRAMRKLLAGGGGFRVVRV